MAVRTGVPLSCTIGYMGAEAAGLNGIGALSHGGEKMDVICLTLSEASQKSLLAQSGQFKIHCKVV